MRYVKARIEQENLDKTYRIYVTDSLKMIAENTAIPNGGKVFSKRYAEFTEKKPEETRSSDEIIDSIQGKLQRLGG